MPNPRWLAPAVLALLVSGCANDEKPLTQCRIHEAEILAKADQLAAAGAPNQAKAVLQECLFEINDNSLNQANARYSKEQARLEIRASTDADPKTRLKNIEALIALDPQAKEEFQPTVNAIQKELGGSLKRVEQK